MAYQTARLLELIQVGHTIAGAFDLPKKFTPAPGQYLPAQSIEGEGNILKQPLFQIIQSSGHNYLGPIPARWQPGDRIGCYAPRGNGFQLPPSAQRVGLLALVNPPIRTLPLVERALAQNAAVALFCQESPHPNLLGWIPSSVEVASLSDLQANLDWPDYLAVEIERKDLTELTALLEEATPGFTGQVLVNTAMPCDGMGKCGVCAVKTSHGWRLACADGPVFTLKELLHVAG